MAKPKDTITQQELKELLSYDPETGIFTWLKDRGRLAKAGCRAGTIIPTGYEVLRVAGKTIRAHRAVWLYVYGTAPNCIIDHINGIKSDNRIANLRDTTYQENAQNRRHGRKGNKSGLLGVSSANGKFQSWINLPDRTRLHLGTFTTPEEAHAAYITAKRKHHPMGTL